MPSYPAFAVFVKAFVQWRHSLFWTIVPAMFVVSCTLTALLMGGATIGEDTRLRNALTPAALQDQLDRALAGATPGLNAAGQLTEGCTDSLKMLAERVFLAAIRDRTGDSNLNGLHLATQSGRLTVQLRTASGAHCEFGADQRAGAPVHPTLQQQLQAGHTAQQHEQANGWTSVAHARPPQAPGAVYSVGIYILSPWTKLTQRNSVVIPVAVFILCINTITALFLVFWAIHRIRRADRVATAWTAGALDTRINDHGRDEFSRLAQKFDLMADALSEMMETKQALAAAEERNRLARDLHDSAKQRAFALNMQLSTTRELLAHHPQGARLLDAALALTSQLQSDLSSVIRRLKAPTMVEAGFRQVLTEGVETMLAGSGIAWSIALDEADEAAIAATPEVAQQLLLITLEAVANVLKHAQCSHCAISAVRDGDQCTWRIADNGAELQADALSPEEYGVGMGLANMRLRADALPDGSFRLHSGPQTGTTVSLTFRLNAI